MNNIIHMPHWPKSTWGKLDGEPLERTFRLLEELGNPQKNMPPAIHVTGTNGKGSTIAFMRSILKAAGYKVHSYTSPHMIKFNERINLNGTDISDSYLNEMIERCRLAEENIDNFKVNFFEGTTVAAILAFSEIPADIVLIEAGLGFKQDPTNSIENKIMTIITTISEDHKDTLGNNIAEIAYSKSALIQDNTPCVASFQADEVMAILSKRAENQNSKFYSYGKDWSVKRNIDSMDFIDYDGVLTYPLPSLIGGHQIVNAGTAIAAVSVLEGFNISGEDIAKGLATTVWNGRMELISTGQLNKMLPENWELWYDGGHNIAAGYAIANITDEWLDKPLYVICGTTKGKDIAALIAPLGNNIKRLYGVPVQAELNSYRAEDIVNAAISVDIPAESCESVEEAIEKIISTETQPSRILVFGSLFFRIELIE